MQKNSEFPGRGNVRSGEREFAGRVAYSAVSRQLSQAGMLVVQVYGQPERVSCGVNGPDEATRSLGVMARWVGERADAYGIAKDGGRVERATT